MDTSNRRNKSQKIMSKAKGKSKTFHIKMRGTEIFIESQDWQWKSIQLLVSSLFKHYLDNRSPEELNKFMELLNVSYEMCTDPDYYKIADERSISGAMNMEAQILQLPVITEADVDRTLFLLDKYVYMKMFVQDFEDNDEEMYLADVEGETARRLSEQDLHTYKTANADIARQKRKWIYNEYKIAVGGVQRSHQLIKDEDVRKAIQFRYIEGWPPMTAVNLAYINKTTFDRKLKAGVASIADSLKLMGILQRKWS